MKKNITGLGIILGSAAGMLVSIVAMIIGKGGIFILPIGIISGAAIGLIGGSVLKLQK